MFLMNQMMPEDANERYILCSWIVSYWDSDLDMDTSIEVLMPLNSLENHV